MKKIILFAICAVFALVSKAQSNTEELKYIQDMIGMKKQQYVAEHLTIAKADADKFWKLYDEYELFRGEIGEKRLENVKEYIANYGKLTDAKADQLMKVSFSISTDMNNLWQKTYNKMAKEISPVKATEFIQIEMYLEAMVRKAVADEIPKLSGANTKK
jgi:hypothetical protein